MISFHPFQVFKSTSEKLLLVSLLLIFAGFSVSRVFMSVGMAGVLLAGLFNLKNFSIRYFFQKKSLLIITFLFWMVLLSGGWSNDKNVWLNFSRIHLPFLLLPLAFILLKPFSVMQFKILLACYVIIFFVSVSVVLGNYFLHFSAINLSIKSGGGIPMPHNHIRYSLLVVMAFFASLYLALKTNKPFKAIAFILAAFFLIAIHVLSVRSALFSLYSALLLLFLLQVKKIGWKKGGMIVAAFFIFIAFLFNAIPSLKNKMSYMRYDISEYTNQKILDASDGMRLRSWKAAVEVAKEQAFYGAGYGDIYDVMNKWYEQSFPEINHEQKKLPHNQFLWWWVSLGYLGTAISLVALFFPLLEFWQTSDWLLKIFYGVLLTSFLWEPTLEEQMGTGFCSLWISLLIHFSSGSRE